MVKIKIENESKSDKFKRLATTRTNKIIMSIRTLSNCSNRGLYDYSEEDVKKIFSTIEKELKLAQTKFHHPPKKKFTL